MPTVTLTNTYDGNDNRTAISDNLSPAGSMSFSYDAAERMTGASLSVSGSTVAQITLGYDAASRLTLISRRTTGTDKTDTSHTFDDADRLTGITHQFEGNKGVRNLFSGQRADLDLAAHYGNEQDRHEFELR